MFGHLYLSLEFADGCEGHDWVTVKPAFSEVTTCFYNRFFMHGESAIQNDLYLATTCVTRPATRIVCTNGRIFPVLSDQKQEKSLPWPHILS